MNLMQIIVKTKLAACDIPNGSYFLLFAFIEFSINEIFF